jgi:transcriptional regulator with XRE-family HTH domain
MKPRLTTSIRRKDGATGDIALGQRIRALRLDRGMIAGDLAARAGVSASFLSQVERGVTSPSLKVLQALANELEVGVALLIEGDSSNGGASRRPPAEIVRADRRKVMRRATGPDYQLLSPDLRGQIEFIWVESPPGEQSMVSSHEGEEQVVVLSGTLGVEIDGEEIRLEAGDAIRFDPSQPHRTINRGTAPAVYLSAITPPSF